MEHIIKNNLKKCCSFRNSTGPRQSVKVSSAAKRLTASFVNLLKQPTKQCVKTSIRNQAEGSTSPGLCSFLGSAPFFYSGMEEHVDRLLVRVLRQSVQWKAGLNHTMRKFRLFPRFMPVTPPPLLWWITKKGRKMFLFFHPLFHSQKIKGSPICPPYHILDLSPFEDITAEFQLNEISHRAQPASPQECPVILLQPHSCNNPATPSHYPTMAYGAEWWIISDE